MSGVVRKVGGGVYEVVGRLEGGGMGYLRGGEGSSGRCDGVFTSVCGVLGAGVLCSFHGAVGS